MVDHINVRYLIILIIYLLFYFEKLNEKLFGDMYKECYFKLSSSPDFSLGFIDILNYKK